MKTSTKSVLTVILGLLAGISVHAQVAFTNSNNLLHSENGVLGSNTDVRSGNSVCVIDVDNDGLDDIVKLDGKRYIRIEYQQAGGTFTHQYVGDIGMTGAWGMSMADVDHNGYKDILYLGGSQAYLIKLNATGTGILSGPTALPNGNIFCQNGNFMDVNNDGWEDIFACNDVGESRLWVNDGTGNFPSEGNNAVIDFNVFTGSGQQNDDSGNYGSVWSDFDGDGDTDFYIIHCRQGRPAGDNRRTNVLFVNDGSNNYTPDAITNTYNLNSNDQDWSGHFGDIDNDGDFDIFMTKHNTISAYYLNNGSGVFGSEAGTINFGNMPMQGQFVDFDNDAYVDLIITGDNDHRLYHNNGNGTFSDITPTNWTVSGNNMLTFASGDLNHDGKIDIYAGYGSTYTSPSSSIDDIYWMNTTSNSNHFLTLILEGTISSVGALGARAYIYGPWGVQTREVRASESYGTCNSYQLHFGLGSATSVDSVRIIWPSGLTDLLVNQNADQFITVVENQCTLSNINISHSGSLTICPGDSVQLDGPTGAGYNYTWSNGSTGQTIYADTTGDYSVTVSTGPTCSATSPIVSVVVNPDETPTITANGDTEFCPGGSVDISSTTASSYAWNSGGNTQTISATTTGYYHVTVPGLCQSWTSDSIYVDVFAAPAPVTSDVFLPGPASTTVSATGNDVTWYDAPTGGTMLGTGSNYNTPFLNNTTTYYAEDSHPYNGSTGNVGQFLHSGSSQYNGSTYNGYVIFDVINDCVLKTVKVYTDTPGDRTIELRDATGTTVLNSITVNIPADSSIVTLNFGLTPGNNYQLGTDDATNNTSFGFDSPRLQRSNTNVSFPYTLSNLVSITSSSAGANNYYYFYDWVVEVEPTVCTSDRSPATVHISGVGIEEENGVNMKVFPNPTADMVNIYFTTTETSDVSLAVFDISGKKVMEMNLGTVNGEYTQTLSLGDLASGVYKVGLTINDKTSYSKVVVK